MSNELRKVESDRIVAIDFLKGLAITFVILAHLSAVCLKPESHWVYSFLYMLLDIFGPSVFAFLSCLGVIFSAKRKKSNINDQEVKKTIIGRALGLLIISILYNFAIHFGRFGVLGIYAWGIFQFIAIGQITTYYCLKIKRYQRFIIAIVLLSITPLIFNYLTGIMISKGIDFRDLYWYNLSEPAVLVYWFIFYPAYMVPLLPWIGIVILGSIIGENLVDANNAYLAGDKNAYPIFYKNLLITGIITTIIGILIGLDLKTEDYGLYTLIGVNSSPFFEWVGVPEFWIHSSVPSVVYTMGVAMIMLAIAFNRCEIKKHQGNIVQMYTFFGRVSLSLYLFQPFFLIGTGETMLVWPIFLYTGFVIAILGWIMYYWNKRFRLTGSPEWFVIVIGGLRSKKSKKRQI